MSLIDQWFAEATPTIVLAALNLSTPLHWGIERGASPYRITYTISKNVTGFVEMTHRQVGIPEVKPTPLLVYYEALDVGIDLRYPGAPDVGPEMWRKVQIYQPHFHSPTYTLDVEFGDAMGEPFDPPQKTSLTLEFGLLPSGLGSGVAFVGQSVGVTSAAFQWLCDGYLNGPAS
ncbi:hypothetical protein ACFQ3P_25975 [Paraburkholderia sabiae]|uniref:Uncharacterized protein n=1 Tax=Paraburkholderia sabiae TaxID=273251 RepID=A0ABU9QL39_9BURK|nr:hypothetical protein [Paraburkholderia sabiae]WJZ77357.1 hypothetical protein QEN71_35405 [Paraburkholderia sabiae]CAD6547660.1 hypothetical protein LMG24235_04459 [Paraburkholderia sabiae]